MARRSGPTTFGSGLKLGVFAVITSLALVLLTDALGGVSLPGAAGYTAMFEDATGLLPGDEVRIAGAKVGEVDDVELEQGNKPLAKVTFDLDEDRDIPESVHATIRYRNMVGQRYIALTQAADGESPSAKNLEPGDVIGVRQTSPALDLTVLLNGFKPLFAALSPDEVNSLSYEIIQTLQGEGSTVESLLSHTASLTSTLAENDETIGKVITNLNDILSTVADRDEELDTSIGRLQEFVSGLSEDREALGEAVSSIGTLTTQTSQLVTDARPALDADISALDELSTTLLDNSATIEDALHDLPNTYQELTTTASYGSWFNFFLCDFDGELGVTDEVTINPVAIHSPQPRCDATGGGS
ncbi:MCE family protein [Stackebrandtia nassauensis]|uniref:Virulence factor Mce family protein n=1 Tax=Stackebrandtia nassauensis (strain DSM 44728 / CIP 108903 / NRRL B-16338 / NBRC 102104 / LLR-40K-21) TaxID=446470 RepID=D3QB62_STANL|nr:MCE family protein [Stackebrandtia nassauensis]ADD40879.1 virulence factor Mce family protein [Stackebrandtia nassauensis DSM 44728]